MSSRAADKKPRLSVERIVDVAMKQLRDKGYDAVTMRSIAAELDTGQASLYAHVANRTELDRLVVTTVMRSVVIPDPDPARWDEQLRDLMHDMMRVYEENPGVARCSLGIIPVDEDAFITVERLLAILRAGKVPDQVAAWFADLMALYLAATAAERDIERQRSETNISHDEVHQIFAGISWERFPVMASMAQALVAGDGDDRFAFGVDVLIAGLKSMA